MNDENKIISRILEKESSSLEKENKEITNKIEQLEQEIRDLKLTRELKSEQIAAIQRHIYGLGGNY
jgi:cell division protein FtsB